ncbi:Cytochrome P450 [Actinomadura madurae]|uniref:Cytochrome P450 n=1 Tax=Actinomadura madurae TaxID=1993 RepID=A0A1I5I0L3_9ACTN|nr:cytochrome P450 [Actinomadura madurae]SFO53581.1 Cytochrome P450 [Actinomadura madurae]
MTATLPELDLDPFSDEVLRDPGDYHRAVREAAPVVRVQQSEGFDLVAVGRYATVRAIFDDPGMFLNSRGGGILDLKHDENFREPGLLQENDPPGHTAIKAVMTSVISPRNLRRMRRQFQVAADELVDRLLQKKTFDAQTDFAEAYPLKVIPDAIMGVREEGRENLLRYSKFLFENMGPLTPRAKQALAEMGDVQTAIAWVRESCMRENVHEGSFGAMIWEAVDRGELTDQQAPNLVRSLIGAGIDTTIHSLANTLHLLVEHQDQWALLRELPTRGKFAYDEAFRHTSTVRQIFRTPAADTDIGGVPVREGQKIMLVLGAANRDPDHWGPTVDRFDITRDAGGHVSLGRGIHQCVGAPIARMEADVLLSTFARRVKSVEFADTPRPMLNNFLRGWDTLPVTITPA